MANQEQTGIPVGVILVTHVDYGASLLKAAEFILGPQNDCSSIQVDVSLDVEGTVARLKDAASLLDKGRGVIILTDMFGGTPTNLSLSLLSKNANVEVVTGVNLPMLLRVFDNRNLDLTKLAELALDSGKKGIVSAGGILRGKGKNS